MKGHDFKRFPELTNSQLEEFYFSSPHRQITEDITASVVKVTDGDTIRVKWSERDFSFPIRFINIAAPESNEPGGQESKNWLERELLGEEVSIGLNPGLRVDKWGRLLAYVTHAGVDVGEMSVLNGHSVPWSQRDEGKIPDWEAEEIGA